MGTSLDRVIGWLDDIRALDVGPLCPHLSPAGARAALETSLRTLQPDALSRAVERPGRPFSNAVMVTARTVFTAPLEWAAVLLGRGTELVLKPARDDAFARELARCANEHGLPLRTTTDRGVVTRAPLVVAMGRDETIRAIATQLSRGTRFLGFGHRFSVAWLTTPRGIAALGEDLALHDGLGCMSPVAVFTSLPREEALQALAETWRSVDARLPGGPPDPAAAARVRQREALARVLGRVECSPGWSVHALPIERFLPAALPRSVALHHVADVADFTASLTPYAGALSTVGTDDPSLTVPNGVRRCGPGEMQRPPLQRLHDGVDWLSDTLEVVERPQ